MAKHLSSHRAWRVAAFAVATSLALTACENKVEKMKTEQMAKLKEVKPTVHVFTVFPQNILLENHLPGRLEARRNVDIVPQVSGVVKRRLFEEGTMVRAGQPLYELDGENFVASLASARANLLSAEAALAKADADVARYRPLVQADAISKQEWDAALTAKRSAEAQIEAAKAAIQGANVQMKHTQIVAPISGFIGQSLVAEGALVNAGTSKMVNITQNDPMYVNITQSSADMLKLRRQFATGEKVFVPPEVSITLEDGSVYAEKGRLLFNDASVDKATGQVTLRASIPNPQQVLMAGMYVRVNLPLAGVVGAFPVPQKAVTRGKTDTVMIVNSAGQPESRTVKIAGQRDGFWIVNEGLKDGDRVIVDGLAAANMMKAQFKVEQFEYKEWQPEASTQTDNANANANASEPHALNHENHSENQAHQDMASDVAPVDNDNVQPASAAQ